MTAYIGWNFFLPVTGVYMFEDIKMKASMMDMYIKPQKSYRKALHSGRNRRCKKVIFSSQFIQSRVISSHKLLQAD